MSLAEPTRLPLPPSDAPGAVAWVDEHLGDLTLEGPGGTEASPAFRGGWTAACAALAAFDVRGYAAKRNQVLPPEDRGASQLSPYIRYGLISLRELWAHVDGGPAADVRKYRDELLWQEYARHLHARLGHRDASALRFEPSRAVPGWAEGWPRDMACVEEGTTELERDGWVVNQVRMWLASQWTVRAGQAWEDGEEHFHRHLLDGSRAANRVGWQWTVGSGTGRPYGFARKQVQRRAPQLCASCVHRSDCPIERYPDAERGARIEPPAALRRDEDPGATAGPARVVEGPREPEAVWLTAESLGDEDPALAAHPELPAVFVFDAPLLARWRLSGKRLVFLAEALADLGERREVHVHRGDPVEVLAGRSLATTHAPVPGFGTRSARLDIGALHPWPWLQRPHSGPMGSFTAWRKAGRF